MALNAEVLTSYKQIDEAYIDELLKKEIEKNNKKIVVLDDDPTGVQTVHDISVYTNWEKDTILQGFDATGGTERHALSSMNRTRRRWLPIIAPTCRSGNLYRCWC